MPKELIFAGKKWWPNDNPDYIGRAVKQPTKDTQMKTCAGGIDFTNMDYQNGYTKYSAYKPTGKVVAQANRQDGIYILPEHSPGGAWFKLSDLIKNGGVLHSLLTHLRKAITPRKELIAWQ